ncbi:hypothetical protein [Lysobacter gummosus]|uniref:hypothetical protein n=1 Tax=Lysobacter gummosus TaxID=262324 RepID=UPI0036372EFF
MEQSGRGELDHAAALQIRPLRRNVARQRRLFGDHDHDHAARIASPADAVA